MALSPESCHKERVNGCESTGGTRVPTIHIYRIITYKITGKRKSWGSGMFLAQPEDSGAGSAPGAEGSEKTPDRVGPSYPPPQAGEGAAGGVRCREDAPGRRSRQAFGQVRLSPPDRCSRPARLSPQGGHDPDRGAVPVPAPHLGLVRRPAARGAQPLTLAPSPAQGRFPGPGKVGLGKWAL